MAFSLCVPNFFAVSNAWCLWEVKKVLGLFPYNRSYWRLTLPTAGALLVALGLRFVLASLRPDIVVVGISTLFVYVIFLGAVLLSGLDADDRMIGDAVWAKVRNSWPTLRPASHD